jgi:hypothetical protein
MKGLGDVVDGDITKISIKILLQHLLLTYGPFDFDIMEALDSADKDYDLVLDDIPESPGHLMVGIREAVNDD